MNTIVWADIPVTNLDRAIKFYSGVLGVPVNRMPGISIGEAYQFDTVRAWVGQVMTALRIID